MIQGISLVNIIRISFFSTLFLFAGCGGEKREALEIEEQESVEAYLLREEFKGAALIVDNGEIVLDRGFHFSDRENSISNKSDTQFRLASITKPFTAVAILILYERGLLDLNDSVSVFIPDYPNGEDITIFHLLTHTSGLIRDYNKAIPNHAVEPEQLIELFKDAPLQSVPGKTYSYSNSGYKLLGYIIEIVTRESYKDFIRLNIFEPLRMLNSGFSPDATDGALLAHGYVTNGNKVQSQNMSLNYSGGGLYSSTNDMLLFDRALSSNYLLEPSTKDLMYTVFKENYALGWKVSESETLGRVFQHGGALLGFTTLFVRFPDIEQTIILLSNEHDVPIFGIGNNVIKILNQ